jgi:DNA-binding response OmpR family regulator
MACPVSPRVLIADPDECLLAAYRECFCEEFDLVTATGGTECIARLHEQTVDLLILEALLPWGGADGVLACMRETPEVMDVPVMILTSCRDRLVLESVSGFRICDYCVKPLSPEQLATRIDNVFKYQYLRSPVFEAPVPSSSERF